jgi:SAM-dependent methyltransferase
LHAYYWDRLAPEYDGLYVSSWSDRENARVVDGLAALELPRSARVLDLGCGTGLGRALLGRLVDTPFYIGLDISRQMLAELSAGARRSAGVQADSGARLPFVDQTFDVVLALFATGSYVPDLGRFFREIGRVLRPAGHGYVSLLSRDSLRRRLGGQSGRIELLRSRGDREPGGGPPACTYAPDEAVAAAGAAGLRVVACRGLNAFSGVIERPFVFALGEALADRRPGLSHSFDLSVRRPAGVVANHVARPVPAGARELVR